MKNGSILANTFMTALCVLTLRVFVRVTKKALKTGDLVVWSQVQVLNFHFYFTTIQDIENEEVRQILFILIFSLLP